MSGSADSTIFYTLLQRRLHWLVLLLLIGQYVLQGAMRDALVAIDSQETLSFFQFIVTTWHTWAGVSVAAIMIWRWQLRVRRVPLADGTLSVAHERWVEWHHKSLYAVIMLMAMTGVLHYYFGFEQAGRWHEWGKWLLAFLVGMHVVGALSHGKHGRKVLQRMMGRNSLR
ncbi:cytochrome b/b6 domain-containing protein [Granulosicoccus antarcticus]|uniref:Cytochrome b561 bacterial/Ni-hydrogenase domain-containing protein n=1 Tax=Granulosicoccus antarcticus IMCC3135 TaxID=1192854 RepID=A0A2Z2P182_9GAMM|nr:cytochrome b/b6 domain-containing protein [Granulosicoccus antarcticus]ASJ76251.1 hypothetical protein IMCC3135_31010 [Granulosicoccus antarcticus IMCC3135]